MGSGVDRFLRVRAGQGRRSKTDRRNSPITCDIGSFCHNTLIDPSPRQKSDWEKGTGSTAFAIRRRMVIPQCQGNGSREKACRYSKSEWPRTLTNAGRDATQVRTTRSPRRSQSLHPTGGSLLEKSQCKQLPWGSQIGGMSNTDATEKNARRSPGETL
jgi:hypothetical protein